VLHNASNRGALAPKGHIRGTSMGKRMKARLKGGGKTIALRRESAYPERRGAWTSTYFAIVVEGERGGNFYAELERQLGESRRRGMTLNNEDGGGKGRNGERNKGKAIPSNYRGMRWIEEGARRRKIPVTPRESDPAYGKTTAGMLGFQGDKIHVLRGQRALKVERMKKRHPVRKKNIKGTHQKEGRRRRDA